jgi:divalent metal cation (Fe/Co/Zn/Cd) transporter
MKHKAAVNIVTTIVFMLGVLVGTLMHGHVMWHDIVAAVIAGLMFGGILFTQFRIVIQKVLQLFTKTK